MKLMRNEPRAGIEPRLAIPHSEFRIPHLLAYGGTQ